jgi:hypothetical protein
LPPGLAGPGGASLSKIPYDPDFEG